MRLINVHGLTLREFAPNATPNYAIASHRWADEVSFQDIQETKNTHKSGYKKIEKFAQYVRDHLDGIDYLWYDSCCIDQKSSADVSEAINSMFRYYSGAHICLAYLADVKHPDDLVGFENSVWHTRGWTLQELLASKHVTFLSSSWDIIGYKGPRGESCSKPALEPVLAKITGIPEDTIADPENCQRFSVKEKYEWIAGRSTTKPEDMVYCLLGLFDVSMPTIYGEGVANARKRLDSELGLVDPSLRPQTIPQSIIPYQQDPDSLQANTA